MAEKVTSTPMARLHLLLSEELKNDIETFAGTESMSVNEAARLLLRRGLVASGEGFTATALLDEFSRIIRDLESRAGPRDP